MRDTGWFKSTRSTSGGDNCVEVRIADVPVEDTGWVKSTRSTGGSENCVEVRITSVMVGVRDSKNVAGPVFTFAAPTWNAFLEATKMDRL